MNLGVAARLLVRLAVALLLIAAAANVWGILASQAPSSRFHVGLLPGPVFGLRDTAAVMALVLMAAAWLMPWAARDRAPRLLVLCTYVGVIVTLAALAYGATTGMLGVQIEDPRAESRWLFWTRTFGQVLLGGCLIDFARRILFRRPP